MNELANMIYYLFVCFNCSFFSLNLPDKIRDLYFETTKDDVGIWLSCCHLIKNTMLSISISNLSVRFEKSFIESSVCENRELKPSLVTQIGKNHCDCIFSGHLKCR